MQRHASAKLVHRPRASVVGGLIARMRDWFASTRMTVATPEDAIAAPDTASVAGIVARRPAVPARQPASGQDTTVVALPFNGRRLLAQLAQELGSRFPGAAEHGDDPLLLTLTTGALPRLWIDSTAHVDVRDDQLPYRVVLGDALTTRVILETTDFAEVTNFVGQYLLLTRGEADFSEGRGA